MVAILNFLNFHKNAYISKTVHDRAMSTKFWTHRVSLESSHPSFSKKSCHIKNGGYFEFLNFLQKIAKYKNAYILKPCEIE